VAISFVGSGFAVASAGGTSITAGLPAGTQKDDILLIACGLNGSDALSCSGYTKKAEYAAGGGGMDLVVHLEMLDDGIRSAAAGQVTCNRSQITLDPADYDGATYYFEVVVTTATTTDYNVELYDVTNATVEATIAMGTTALTYKRLRSAAFTPTAGASAFKLRIDQTTTNSDVIVFTARIVVVQTGATKTRLQFPLAGAIYSHNQTDTGGSIDSATGNVYMQTTPGRFNLLKKEAAKLATIASGTPWTLEAVLSLGTTTDTAYCALYNATDGVAVTGAEVTHTGDSAVTYKSIDFANDAVNFSDLDEFEARIKCNHGTRLTYLYSARLYVRLTTLTKAQCFLRIGRHWTGTGGDSMPWQKAYYDAAQWSAGTTWYLEATGIDASASPAGLAYWRWDADDVGTGSAMGTYLTMSGTKSRQRGSAVTLTDEYRYMGRAGVTTGTASFSSEFLIAELSVVSGDEAQVTVFWKRHTGSEANPVVSGAATAIIASVRAFRGVDLGANPWDVYDGGLLSGIGDAATPRAYFPALTTATDGAMAVGVAATADNNTYDAASVGYGNLSAPRGSTYNETTYGDDVSVFILHGTQATAGTIGSPYGTQTTLGPQFYVSTIGALKPAVAVSTFALTIACQVADEVAAPWLQPVITGYSSTNSEVGGTIVIAGTDLGTDGQVRFGTTVAVVTAWSATQVQVTIPNVADGSYTVTIAPYGDYYTTSFVFVVDTADPTPVAIITWLQPSSGMVGTSVTITGTDFGAAGVVKFDATTATQTSYSATSIVVAVPDAGLGAKSVTVTPTGKTASAGVAFTILATTTPVFTPTNPLFDGTLEVKVGGLDVTNEVLAEGRHWGNTNPGGFGEATLRLPAPSIVTARHSAATVPGAVLELLAAAAKDGLSPGVNSPLTTEFFDVSGNENHGTLTNFAGTTASGWAGSGTEANPYRLVFDGTDDYVSAPAIAFGASPFTVEAWIIATGAGTHHPIFGCWNGAYPVDTDPGYIVYLDTGQLRIRMCDGAGNLGDPGGWLLGCPDLRGAGLTHVLIVWDGTYIRAYVAGFETGNVAWAYGSGSPTANTLIGKSHWGYYAGSLLALRAYPMALTPDHVAQNYAAGLATLDTLAPQAWTPYDDAVVKGAAVTIKHGATPVTLFEGEVTGDVSHATIEGGKAFYDVTCAGLWWKAGQRKDFCRIWTDDDYGQWFAKPTAAKAYSLDTEGKLEVRIEKGQTAKQDSPSSLYYWISSGMGDSGITSGSIAYLIATVEVDTAVSASWHAKILSSEDSPWGTLATEQEWHDEIVAAGTPLFLNVGTSRTLGLRLESDIDNTTTADRFITLRRIAVCGEGTPVLSINSISKASPAVVTTGTAHGLKVGDRVFIGQSDSVADIDGWHAVASTPLATTFTMYNVNVLTTAGAGGFVVRALCVDEAMADVAVAGGLATSSSLQTGGIGNVNWGLSIRPHMSRAEAIDLLGMTHAAPIDYGFWDGAVFYCQERVASPPGANDYVIDARLPGINFDVSKSVEDAPTHVKILYKFRDVEGGDSDYPDGTVLAFYWPSEPDWDDASVVLDVWDEWADFSLLTVQAEYIGRQILSWLDENAYQGTITMATPTIPLRTGGTKLLAYVRAGDYVGETNLETALNATTRWMITGYDMDPDSGTATLTIGENRRAFVARISRHKQMAPMGTPPDPYPWHPGQW
jgi:hypothetical protein